MLFWTFCSNNLLLFWSSSAASLFNGSSGFGSWNCSGVKLLLSFLGLTTYKKEVLQSVHYGIYGQNWLPILSQDIKTNISLQINVRMIHFRLTFHLQETHAIYHKGCKYHSLYLGRFMRICCSNFKTESKLSVSVETLKCGKMTKISRKIFNEKLTSSGKMISLKLSRSSGSGNSVLHVFGNSNSLIS